VTKPSRRDLFRTGAVGLGAAALGSNAPAASATAVAERSFHHDHVLGTSFDVWLDASASAAGQAETVVLDEIERLRKVFSLHDPESELCRLNRASGRFAASPDLLAVLSLYEQWQRWSEGALNAQVGGLTRAWEQANGTEPDAAALAKVVRRIQSPGWTIDGSTVTRHTDQPFNLNSVAKGYILQKAADAVKRVAGISAGLVNLGGDMAAWGGREWAIGVQDPFNPAENADPLTTIRLTNQAVATSGGYMRSYTVGGQKRSHLLDPRTGQPADGVAGATVVAADSTTANTLATALCVLGAAEGLRLAERAGTAALLVDSDGRGHRTATFARYELPTGDEKKADPANPDRKGGGDEKKGDRKAEAWPEDYQVTLSFELPSMPGGRYRRPYVAFWVENADGKAVRTVAVWGNSPKWLPTMSGWWKHGKDNKELLKAVTKATRAPGKYELVWDGKDDAGNPVPQGTYTVKLEVHREHGKDQTQTGKVKCEAADDQVTMEKKDEVGESTVAYAKKPKKEKDK
jgi:thiamine biosynthesis lipoprotein ApbE